MSGKRKHGSKRGLTVLNPKQTGELRLVIDFGANPGANLVILVYGEFKNILEINANRVVLYDVYR